MKISAIIVFFTIFFALYGLINFYIFIRGWQALPNGSTLKPYYIVLFLIVSLSFIGGRVLERVWLSPVSDIFVWIGSFWLAALLYFFLTVVLLDLARLVNHFVPYYPSVIKADYAKTKLVIAIGALSLVTLLLAIGHLNATFPRVKTLTLHIAKKVDGPRTLNIVSASDIHIGAIIGKKRVDRYIKMINDLKPDIVFLPGDIVDEDLGPVIRENIGEALKQIKAPLGVYAITGNHEYIGGAEKACKYLSDHGITMLRDSVAMVDNLFYLVGREDRSKGGFSGIQRKKIQELMDQVDKNYPIIMLDHQPFNLQEVSDNGVDLQISGHTHHGQIWPLNYITEKVYEISWGYWLKGSTNFYVSCGVGTWGPPVRIGNRPEIVNIKLSFD